MPAPPEEFSAEAEAEIRLRPYLPALRQARRALEEKADRLTTAFEPHTRRQVQRARRELDELVETLTPEDPRAS